MDYSRPVQIALDSEIEKDLKKVEGTNYDSLRDQVRAEVRIGQDFMHPKHEEAGLRLKLYNNQRRDKDKIGDPLLFTVFQTILAALYDDNLTAVFSGRDEGDEEVAENLNAMAKYDAELMGKDIVDYEWIWDALFFGRSVVALHEFYRDPENKIFVPLPHVWDPMVFLRDPRATSINGHFSVGGLKVGGTPSRFLGRYVSLLKRDMQGNPGFDQGAVSRLGSHEKQASVKDLVERAREVRQDAQGEQNTRFTDSVDLGDNTEHGGIEWFTFWKGKPCHTIWDADITEPLKYKELDPKKPWPLIDRPMYPTAHDWDGASVPDFVEDKQRARAVVQNLTLAGLKAKLHPMYLYDKSKITNKGDLKFEFNKMVPVAGDPTGAVVPMQKDTTDMGMVDFILETLDVAAQRATATPEIQQGVVSAEKRTLGEINLVASKADTRYSLSSRVFGWSERRFWQQYYSLYKEHLEGDIDEKIIRITGAYGPKWRKLGKENIIASVDPDVSVESSVLSEARRFKDRALFNQYLSLVTAIPDANLRYGARKAGALHGMSKEEIDRILPPTIDELIAEEENDKLNKNERIVPQKGENHTVHLELHSKAADTPATYAHIETHKEAMRLQQANPELFPELAAQQAGEQALPGTPGTPGAQALAQSRPAPATTNPTPPTPPASY